MTRGRELAGAAGTMRMTEDKIPQQEWVSRDVSGGLRRLITIRIKMQI